MCLVFIAICISYFSLVSCLLFSKLVEYVSSLYVYLILALNEKENTISKEAEAIPVGSVLGGILVPAFIITILICFFKKKVRRVNIIK